MHAYAQTNIQLFNQLRLKGYSDTDLRVVRDAYELAMALFTGRFQPSGKSFMAHVVGTASILASLQLPAPVVAAGLLHNVYQTGDFGDGRSGISTGRRQTIKRILGQEVEEYVASFPALYWKPRMIQLARENPSKLVPAERVVIFIWLADLLEHLSDFDILYYADAVRGFYVETNRVAVEVAERLGLSSLAAELKEAIRVVQLAQIPVEIPFQRMQNSSFVVAPNSCRKRFTVSLRQSLTHGVDSLPPQIRKMLKPLYLKSAKFVKDLMCNS